MGDDNMMNSPEDVQTGAEETSTETTAEAAVTTDDVQIQQEPQQAQAEVQLEQTGSEEKPKKGKMSLKKKLLLAGIPTLVAIGVAAGVIYYVNTPEQRFLRQINLGVKSLQELDYETAKASFDSAIQIDNTDLEAYQGLMKAYAGLNDKTGMADTYERAYQVISDNMDSYSDEDKEVALEILRYVRLIYGDDINKEIENTELAYALYPDNQEFKGILIDDYYILGKEALDKKDYAKGIEYLEKALELDPDNKEIKARRDRAVKDYISYAFDNGDYDLVLELVKKYKGEVEGIDETFINAEIAEINRIKAEEARNFKFYR